MPHSLLNLAFELHLHCAKSKSALALVLPYADLHKDKDTLGHAMGKEFRASLAILDEGFAKEIMKQMKTEDNTVA